MGAVIQGSGQGRTGVFNLEAARCGRIIGSGAQQLVARAAVSRIVDFAFTHATETGKTPYIVAHAHVALRALWWSCFV